MSKLERPLPLKHEAWMILGFLMAKLETNGVITPETWNEALRESAISQPPAEGWD